MRHFSDRAYRFFDGKAKWVWSREGVRVTFSHQESHRNLGPGPHSF